MLQIFRQPGQFDTILRLLRKLSRPLDKPRSHHVAGDRVMTAAVDGVKRLDRPDARFVDVLVEAFRNEPHNSWIFRTDERRDEAIARYLTVYLEEIRRNGADFLMSMDGDACAVIGRNVEADHHLSLAALSRVAPAVIKACSPWRIHRMLAMELALSRAHIGLRHLPHGVFIGAVGGASRSRSRLIEHLLRRYPALVLETADPRVAALARRNGLVETGRTRPAFGGPEMIFLLHQSYPT